MTRFAPLVILLSLAISISLAQPGLDIQTENLTGLSAELRASLEGHGHPRIALSPKGDHWAVVKPVLSRFAVWVDGKQSQEWDEIGSLNDPGDGTVGPTFVFSADGDRVAYVASKNGTIFLVVGDDTIAINAPAAHRAGQLQFSLDGRRYAMIVKNPRRNLAWVIADAKVLGPYIDVLQSFFSENGAHHYYAAQKGTSQGRDTLASIYVDGMETYRDYSTLSDIVCNREGTQLAYAAASSDGWKVFLNGKPYPGSYLGIKSLTLSADGSTSLFSGAPLSSKGNASGEVVVLNGVAGRRYDSVSGLTLAPNGRRFAYVGSRPDRAENSSSQYFVVDGTEVKTFPPSTSWIPPIHFSGDSANVGVHAGSAFVFVNSSEFATGGTNDGTALSSGDQGAAFAYKQMGDDNILRVVVNGKPSPPLTKAELNELSFSHDGTSAAFPGNDLKGKSVVVHGERVYQVTRLIDFGGSQRGLRQPSQIAISGDGKHIAYHTDGHVSLDGAVGPSCHQMSRPYFDGKSEHLAFACREESSEPHGAKRWRIYLDGLPGPVVDSIFDRQGQKWSFDSSGVLEITALGGNQLQRIRIVPPAGGLSVFSKYASEKRSLSSQGGTQGHSTGGTGATGANGSPPQKTPSDNLKDRLKDAARKRLRIPLF